MATNNLLSFFVFFVTSTPTIIHGCQEQWSNWEITSPCPDYCGGGFNGTYTRTCINATACPCTGFTTITKPCNQNICKFPRNSCFGSLKSIARNGEVICISPDAINKTDPFPDTYPCCPPQGIWGSWIETSSCNDTCGGYGTLSRRRICLSEEAGCPCIGDAIQASAQCNTVPCSDRAPCATGLTLTVIKGAIVCSKAESIIKPSSCCPTFGVWELWGSWSSCSSSCGGCAQATRTRTCASEKYGCPCFNSTTKTISETQACNRNACLNGTKCCSPLVPFTLGNGEVLCFPPNTKIPLITVTTPPTTTTTTSAVTPPTSTVTKSGAGEGIWSEWSISGCTESCGLCGRIIKKRICKNGLSCIGESQINTTKICGGPTLCPLGLRLPSCCEPANRAIIDSEYRCILSTPTK